jgi:malic enzyme
MMAASRALADLVRGNALLPEMMDPATHAAVAQAVADAVK